MLTIKLSPFGGDGRTNMVSSYPWPAETYLQGGSKGVVIVRNGQNYTTAFIEAVPPEGGFFRGEGPSLEEAETKAWEKYVASRACANHEWEARGYTNGGGFCKHCNTFGSNVFSGEQLGQLCATCNEGTTYINYEDQWWCKEHYPLQPQHERYFELLRRSIAPGLSEEERTEYQNLRKILDYQL